MHANEWVFEIIDCEWPKRAYEAAIDCVSDPNGRRGQRKLGKNERKRCERLMKKRTNSIRSVEEQTENKN